MREPTPDIPAALSVRSWILYGAAAGMLIGLCYVAVLNRDEVTEVVIWRNFILGGAATGLLTGWLIRFTRRSHPDE